MAELCYHRAHYAAQQIAALPGFDLITKKPFFKEFVVRCPISVEKLNAFLLDKGIVGGYDLSKDYPRLRNCMLLCVTEMNTREEIDRLVEMLREVSR